MYDILRHVRRDRLERGELLDGQVDQAFRLGGRFLGRLRGLAGRGGAAAAEPVAGSPPGPEAAAAAGPCLRGAKARAGRQEDEGGQCRDGEAGPFMMHGLDIRQFLKEGRRMPDHNR